MKLFLSSLLALSVTVVGVQAFLVTPSSVSSSTSTSRMTATIGTKSSAPSPSARSMVNVPRLELPEPVAEKLDEYGLKNPNDMTPQEYQDYSGAAILGTLVFFFLPGAILTGTYADVVTALQTATLDFVLSALIGGGGAIYLSLKDDDLGEKVRDLGNSLLTKAKEVTGITSTPRYDLPAQITDVVEGQLGLLSPNDMSEEDYEGYAGAAVAGTLAFFLLPGAILTGGADVLASFFAAVAVNLILSALIGGGLTVFLSLRDDEIAKTVNLYGGGFLDKVDEVLDSSPNSS